MSLRSVAPAGSLVGLSALVLAAAPAQAASSADASDAPLPVAHRGASAYAPENTLAAVDKARELGIQWVENDVQRTKDGELVIIHDDTLSRTTNVEEVFPDRAPWKVADFTAEEISRLDAGSWFGPEYEGHKVPTLEQYLDRVSGNNQKLLMEIKKPELYPGIEADVLEELNDEGWLDREHVNGKLIIQSFSEDSVRSVHEQAPEIKTGFLGTPEVAELPRYARFTDQINPRYTTVTEDYVRSVHALKGAHGRPLEVFTWTVDDAENAQRVADMGVDGIISNKPDVIRDATDGSAGSSGSMTPSGSTGSTGSTGSADSVDAAVEGLRTAVEDSVREALTGWGADGSTAVALD